MEATDDGDSRDSGFSDMTTGTISKTTFDLLDGLRDMDEVFLSDNSNDSTEVICQDVIRVKCTETISSQESSSAARRLKIVDTTFHHRSSANRICRKRVIEASEDFAVANFKKCRTMELANIENETPPSRKCVRQGYLKKQQHVSRSFSTSTLEIKQHEAEDELPIIDDSQIYHLPTLPVKDHTMAFRRVSPATLCDLMNNMSLEEFNSKYILVDCRYPYEFGGGHIKGAVNICEQKICDDFFFDEKFNRMRVPIFYCEYSQKRGPTMATLLRSNDRGRNLHRYPKLLFQELYVLDTGYKGFFEHVSKSQQQNLCSPCGYIQMDDYRYTKELRQFTLHRKYYRSNTCIESSTRNCKKGDKIQARRHLFRNKTVQVTPSSPIEETPHTPELTPRVLNFSLSSPEISIS